MSIVKRSTGVVLDLDLGVEIVEVGSAPRTPSARGLRRSKGPSPIPGASVAEAVVEGLADLQVVVVDSFDVVGTGGARVGLNLAGAEVAVVLLERDGLYNWVYPERRPGTLPSKALQFEVGSASARRRRMRGGILELVADRVRAYVFKFVARLAAKAALKALESRRKEGLVLMSGAPADWHLVDRAKKLGLPRDRGARLLLFIHGAFSSTRGDFGGLGLSELGAAWLAGAGQNYDAILGYDHRTLTADPLENAADLAARLAQLTDAPEVDVVGFSRGALVVRSLVELLPPEAWSGRVRKAVLVGSPNAGTTLADPDRWEHLADLYTNLASLGCNALRMIAPASPAAAMLKESVSSVAAFVTYLASVSLDRRVAPGLAALSPDGGFLARLNRVRRSACDYYLVQSDFDLQLLARDPAERAFPRRLALWLLDVLADAFMGAPNDLVVETASMATGLEDLAKGRLRFGRKQQVHHWAYFTRPELLEKLERWLDQRTTGRRRRAREQECTGPAAPSSSPPFGACREG